MHTGTIYVQIKVRAVPPSQSQPKNPSQQNVSIECIEETYIPLQVANWALKPDPTILISSLIVTRTEEGILSATVAVGSLKCMKGFPNQMQCATRIQQFWKRARYNKRSPQHLFPRTVHKPVQDLSLNAELRARSALVIQHAWHNKGVRTPHNHPFLKNRSHTNNYPQTIIQSQQLLQTRRRESRSSNQASNCHYVRQEAWKK